MTTAAGRLWRRAPLWRLLLATTLVFGVLTALYPAPSLRLPAWPRQAVPSPGRAVSGAIATPIDPPQRGTLRIAGRVVPLPEGDWHELVAGRVEEATEVSAMILARWQAGTLTGFLTVLASTGPAEQAGIANPADICDASGNYAVRWSDAGTTCWLIRARTMPPPVPPTTRPDTLDGAALQRLQALGVSVPATLSTTIWSHTDGHEVLRYELSVTDARDPHDGTAALAALQGWMTRFSPLLRRGYDRAPSASAIRTVARDPGLANPPGAVRPRG